MCRSYCIHHSYGQGGWPSFAKRLRRARILGDYCDEEPPLTIPNREVKLISADGTAFVGE